jgi:hypothetical protein
LPIIHTAIANRFAVGRFLAFPHKYYNSNRIYYIQSNKNGKPAAVATGRQFLRIEGENNRRENSKCVKR